MTVENTKLLSFGKIIFGEKSFWYNYLNMLFTAVYNKVHFILSVNIIEYGCIMYILYTYIHIMYVS